MFFTADQLMLHFIGDYLLQTHRMAQRKLDSFGWALWHAFVYSLPFALLATRPETLLIIWLSHALIDHYRLGARVSWLKNRLDDPTLPPFKDCPGGYPPATPGFLAVWLAIIVDNLLHLLINAAALAYVG